LHLARDLALATAAAAVATGASSVAEDDLGDGQEVSSGDEDWDAGMVASERSSASPAGVGQDKLSIYYIGEATKDAEVQTEAVVIVDAYTVAVQVPREPESLQELECWTLAMRAAAGQAVVAVAGTAPAAGAGTLVTVTPPRAMLEEAGMCVPARSACSLAALPPFPGGAGADGPLEHGVVEEDSSAGADGHHEGVLHEGGYGGIPAGAAHSCGVARSTHSRLSGVARLRVLERHLAAAGPFENVEQEVVGVAGEAGASQVDHGDNGGAAVVGLAFELWDKAENFPAAFEDAMRDGDLDRARAFLVRSAGVELERRRCCGR
jgi:hypothetical protein